LLLLLLLLLLLRLLLRLLLFCVQRPAFVLRPAPLLSPSLLR
jgi:hypothetical protein